MSLLLADPMRAALGRAVYWRHMLFSRHRLEAAVMERVNGLPLVVLPGVFNPVLLRTGAFFAAALAREPLVADAEVLDLGTGTGVCAIAAARHARRVVAVDVSPAAVRCAGINAVLNGLEHKIDVLQGDLFAPVRGRPFDVVLFNPPFLRGEPRSEADRAWRSVDVAERFAAQLRDHLAPAGVALLLLSTFGDADAFLGPLAQQGFALAPHAERRYFNERLTLFRVSRPSRGRGVG